MMDVKSNEGYDRSFLRSNASDACFEVVFKLYPVFVLDTQHFHVISTCNRITTRPTGVVRYIALPDRLQMSCSLAWQEDR